MALAPRAAEAPRRSPGVPGTRGTAEPVGDRRPQALFVRQGRDDQIAPLPVEVAQEPVQPARVGGHGARHCHHGVHLHRRPGEGGREKDTHAVPGLLRQLSLGCDLRGLDEDDPRPRRVVRRVLSGHPDRTRRRDREPAPKCSFEVLARDPAGPQDARGIARDIDDGRLHADCAGAAVQDEVDGITELRMDVVGGGRADGAEAVGRRGGDTAAEGGQQRERDGVVGHPHRHRLQTTGRFQGHPATPPQDQRERPRPEAFRQQASRLRHLLDPGIQHLRAAEMDDQRVGRGAPLHLENARDSHGILGVRPQTVDGLGRESHQPPGAQHPGRLLDVTSSRHHPRHPKRTPRPRNRRHRWGTGSLMRGCCVTRSAVGPIRRRVRTPSAADARCCRRGRPRRSGGVAPGPPRLRMAEVR
ncbi:hypothetical protein SBRY_90139 [Actinacidiphila bryophytorum]|uniref:Uncharacterized protein n=1 Tax=Actinacidiphila bryophytorum TaxID=1436133 RepID=A0A9W4H7P2_9ACTN|nr:hypothetical protein SBRY_90139 [Actinacidiphila bryophytorum]